MPESDVWRWLFLGLRGSFLMRSGRGPSRSVGIWASRIPRGTGKSSSRAGLESEFESVPERPDRPDRPRSSEPMTAAIRFSPSAMAWPRERGEVGERRRSVGRFRRGWSSGGGVDGEWKVAPFLRCSLWSEDEDEDEDDEDEVSMHGRRRGFILGADILAAC